VLVGDGMGDYPLKELGGRTPLEAAETPSMDRIAACRVGLVRTIPDGMEPGSDVANLSLLGYDPRLYHARRAPFEAASMGVGLEPDQVAFRMNLVTLAFGSDRDVMMVSHSSGDISAEEAGEIVLDLKEGLHSPEIAIYRGVGYRHLLVWEKGPEEAETIPPHDVLGQNMAPYLNDSARNPVPEMIRRSWPLLREHPVNQKRREAGEKEANSIWLWGQGRAPKLPLFQDKYGLKGAVICAVDLLRGIGIYAGFTPILVKGATGYLNTNYRGKAEAALKALEELDFVFLHVEAPDEAGHHGDFGEKIEAIENFDRKVVGTVLEGLTGFEDYRVMVISDHLTPVVKRTHTNEPTPFAWASKEEIEAVPRGLPFTEASALKSGLIFEEGHELMPAFLSGK
ncbi:MAG: cofactor-independent phosphoglycerate mutase, partial [Proteobacteria bacterium]|nr:cofactor-independent phosphoglycerate mutase [Pseudomonadota bacterium]